MRALNAVMRMTAIAASTDPPDRDAGQDAGGHEQREDGDDERDEEALHQRHGSSAPLPEDPDLGLVELDESAHGRDGKAHTVATHRLFRGKRTPGAHVATDGSAGAGASLDRVSQGGGGGPDLGDGCPDGGGRLAGHRRLADTVEGGLEPVQ